MMSEERFRVRFEQEDGRGEIVNEKGVELTAREVVDKLNEQQATIKELERKLKKYSKIGEEQLKQIIKLQDLCGQSDLENAKLRIKNNEQQATIERLQEKVTDYEIILSITDDKRTLCKEQQIDDVAFYCERYSDYRCYPLCPNTKDCFKADGTFQEKLKDLKEFWGEKWK